MELVTYYREAQNYFEVLKPRETSLLTFIGLSAAVVAGEGHPPLAPLSLALVAILVGSAGCNALTNYLDRDVDARMQRTCFRVLPSRRIDPPEKMLPLATALLALGLGIAWYLHPLAFLSGLVGTLAAVLARKTPLTHFLGIVSGCAPVLVGWFAIDPQPGLPLLLILALIVFWVPLHVWSLMLAYRDDYLQAGVCFFPVSRGAGLVTKILLALAFLVYASSVALYLAGAFGWTYLAVANISGIFLIYGSYRLLRAGARESAWKLYKLSAYPYLGLIFLVMNLDLWIQSIV